MADTLHDDRAVVSRALDPEPSDRDRRAADGPDDPDGPDAPDGAEGAGGPSGRRGRRLSIAAMAAVAVVAGLLAVTAPTPQPTENVDAGLGPPLVGDGRATVATSSQALRSRPVTALSETHLLVWGGDDGSGDIDRADGFAIELSTGEVAPIPNAPITRLSQTDGAWTGSELVVVSSSTCTSCSTPDPDAAAWDPEGGWRGVADPPSELGAGTVGAVWTGAQVVVVARSGRVAGYDPARDRWTDLPAVDVVAAGSPSLAWTGREVVYLAADAAVSPASTTVGGPIADRGWTWQPGSSAWEPLPVLPEGHRTLLGSVAWTGTEVVVWGAATGTGAGDQVGVGARLRPGDGAWTPLPASPQSPAPGGEATVGSQALSVDRATGRVVVAPLDLTGGTGTRDLLVLHAASWEWATTDIALGGTRPTFVVTGGMLLVPHPGTPVAARLP